MRGNNNSEEQHAGRGNKTGLFTVVWGFCAVNRKKNIIYFHLHFMRMGAVSVSMTIDESSFAINHYFNAFDNIYSV